ncbi:16S rRNA (adenine(1518)-N(6)/adenine(1519)-N(6))-dimethyltransferase RsmA [Pelagibacteraceae bacterium]|nr:16S rRNA (adenine(1518)-N(6)/adenine(1519)-N(6))-dimethyltransferase RsmA [Pelagibacteraceae bacterium]
MIKSKKSLSQNFLFDKNIANKIINLVEIENRIILEIGPGLGFMTDFILKKNPKYLYVIEKDNNLAKELKNKYKKNNRIKIIEKDILKFDLSNFKNLIIISNLPYNISTKIILYLFKYNKNINQMIFMIQKEVAIKFDYMLPNMNKYKFLTKITSSFERCFDVSSKVFQPKPKVTSSVVRFQLNEEKLNLKKANIFINLIFKNIRKKIYKNLKLDNKHDNLYNKRVNEISIKDLLNIYNSFQP